MHTLTCTLIIYCCYIRVENANAPTQYSHTHRYKIYLQQRATCRYINILLYILRHQTIYFYRFTFLLVFNRKKSIPKRTHCSTRPPWFTWSHLHFKRGNRFASAYTSGTNEWRQNNSSTTTILHIPTYKKYIYKHTNTPIHTCNSQ